jgi:hypothetical protein
VRAVFTEEKRKAAKLPTPVLPIRDVGINRLAVIMHRIWADGTEFRWTRKVAVA